jgi:hypothetical protein
MSLTTTTSTAAINATDVTISVTAGTGATANGLVQFGQEFARIASSYVSGTLIPLAQRAVNGTFVDPIAIPSGSNVTFGAASDFAGPSATVVTAYPLAGRRRKVVYYSAAGAIALPVSGEDVVAIINGTSALAMTIAAPTKDIDGSMIVVMGNGAAAHTVQFTGGLSGAGSSYDVVTVNATAPIALMAFAANGLWISPVTPAMTGTVTNITGGVA